MAATRRNAFNSRQLPHTLLALSNIAILPVPGQADIVHGAGLWWRVACGHRAQATVGEHVAQV